MGQAVDKVCFLIHDLRWLGGAERTFVTYINNATRFEPVAVLVRPHLDMGHELRRPVPLFSLEDPSDVASGGLLNRARHALVSMAPASLVRKAHRLTVVHNPIDLHHIKTRAGDSVTLPAGWSREGLIVVAVGRLVKLKGFDLLLQAFARLPDSMGARLLIVGDGEERAALSRAIDQLSLSERVVMVGWQTNPWQYMARAHALVVPSLTEAFPNVIGEALALGLPVLATDCSGGVREYLEDGLCGLLVPAGD